MDEAIENIDIGGPSMLRSAAKNYKYVTVVCDPTDYKLVLAEIKEYGNTTAETRLRLSAKAFTHTADYDAAISTYMREKAGLPEVLRLRFEEKQALRYGENPIRRLSSTEKQMTSATAWRLPFRFREKSSPTTTFRMPTLH